MALNPCVTQTLYNPKSQCGSPAGLGTTHLESKVVGLKPEVNLFMRGVAGNWKTEGEKKEGQFLPPTGLN